MYFQPRGRQACEICRAQKKTCRPSPTPDVCERCLQNGRARACVPHVPRSRTKRSKGITTLEASPPNSPRCVPSGADISTQQSSQQGYRSAILGLEEPTHSLAGKSDPAASQFGQILSLRLTDLYGRIIYNHELDLSEAEAAEFLSLYVDQLHPHFPILALRQQTSAAALLEEAPLLLLSILVVSSSSNERLQSTLNEHFRKTLAQRATVNGETSLDLLQSLLLYLAWHHHYLDHRTQQMYQYLQQAVGMVVDLHLDEPLVTDSDSDTGGEETRIPRLRAYLGCYYLSCVLSVLGFNKPQTLALPAQKLDRIKTQLQQASSSVDRDWISLAELMQIVDTFSRNAEATTTAATTTALVDHALSALSTWKRHTLLGPHDRSHLLLPYYSIHVFVYKRALLSSGAGVGAGGAQQPYYTTPLLHATTSALDAALFRPAAALRAFNIVETGHLLACLVTTARLRPETRELDGYLDAILAVAARAEVQDSAPALFSWLAQIVRGLQGWLERKKGGDEGVGVEATTFETVKRMTVMTQAQALQTGGDEGMSASDTTVVADSEPGMTEKDWDELMASWQDIPLPLSF